MSKRIKGSRLRNINERENISDKKIKDSRIKNKSDKQLEREAIEEENISIMAVVIVVILCFIIGILLGWGLYKLAINNSNIAFVINGMFFR